MKHQLLTALLIISSGITYSSQANAENHNLFACLDQNNSSASENDIQTPVRSSTPVAAILKPISLDTKPEDIENPKEYNEKLVEAQSKSGKEFLYSKEDEAKFDLVQTAIMLENNKNSTENHSEKAETPTDDKTPTDNKTLTDDN